MSGLLVLFNHHTNGHISFLCLHCVDTAQLLILSTGSNLPMAPRRKNFLSGFADALGQIAEVVSSAGELLVDADLRRFVI